MNPDPRLLLEPGRKLAWMLGVIGTLALMALLVTVLLRSTRPEDLTAARTRERFQFREEVRAADAQAIERYAWQDQAKGLDHLQDRVQDRIAGLITLFNPIARNTGSPLAAPWQISIVRKIL